VSSAPEAPFGGALPAMPGWDQYIVLLFILSALDLGKIESMFQVLDISGRLIRVGCDLIDIYGPSI
jgi:hypothetical protein